MYHDSRNFPSDIAHKDLGINEHDFEVLDGIFSENRYPQTFDNVTQVINMFLYWKMRTTWFYMMHEGLWVNYYNDCSAFDTVEFNLSTLWKEYISIDWDEIARNRACRSDDDQHGQINLEGCEDSSHKARSLFDIRYTLDVEYEDDGESTQTDFDNEDGTKSPNEVSVCNFLNFADTCGEGWKKPLANILMKPEIQKELEKIAADNGLIKKSSDLIPTNVTRTNNTYPQPIFYPLVLVHDIMEKRWIDGCFLQCLVNADERFHGKNKSSEYLQKPHFKMYAVADV